MPNQQQLANELHKPIIRKFEKRKVYFFKDNIWGVDLADLQLISKYNKGMRYELCVIDLFSKYAWVVPLKVKKGITIVNAFQKILDNSKRKPSKIWTDQGSEFYSKSFKNMLQENNITMYSIHNKEKSVIAERFIKSLKNKIYKHLTAISKNVYFDVLNDIVDEYNNTYHTTIKMKPIDVKYDSFAEYNEESNEKDPKFKIGDHVRISKYLEVYRSSRDSVNVEVDMSCYATKADLKNVAHVDVSSFALKSNLASLKTEVYKIGEDKLKTVDLSKQSNVVNNDIAKKTVYVKLAMKVNNIDTTRFILKIKYDTEKLDLEKKFSDAEKKIPNTSALVEKTDYNSKITEIEGKIPSISNLVEKTNYNTKISEIESKVNSDDHDEYITTLEFIKLTTENFKARLAQGHILMLNF